ncbi:phosphoadenosine phosphosulfate reductase family protein [Streptomyces sp. NPDC088354]|uniref:phosphoadenosine phosphosulfate reductase domain-containing protein n=1 Tax=Streptomyces sp. NPDC088354 TaxID=3365856 RepID=UPI00382C47A5
MACFLSSAVRILYALGLRAEESSGRARKPSLDVDRAQSNGKRTIPQWHPIIGWDEQTVWRRIADSGVQYGTVRSSALSHIRW